MRRVLFIVGILLLPIILVVLVVTGVIGKKPTTAARVSLTVWGTEDSAGAYSQLIAKYNSARPYATITYKRIRSEDYYDQLVAAWAQGVGPDIFFVPNTWVGKMMEFAEPMPATSSIPIVQVKNGLLGKQTDVTLTPQTPPSATVLKQTYIDAVLTDTYRDGKLWGLPQAMDTLVLYYNETLLNNARIFEPASTWGDLVTQITTNQLTVVDSTNAIVRSAVPLGTAENVPYSADLLALLMQQNGAKMIGGGRALFNNDNGRSAVEFYTSFAQESKQSYSWNDQQPNGLEAFLAGKAVYYFGTHADRAAIAKSRLQWGVAPMLQIDRSQTNQQIDIARYQVAMVSKASKAAKRSANAWNFVTFISRSDIVPTYLKVTGKLSAQKKILAGQQNDPDLGVYTGQLLTAKSWYTGRGGPQAEEYLRAMIQNITSGKASVDEAMKLAADQITSTL